MKAIVFAALALVAGAVAFLLAGKPAPMSTGTLKVVSQPVERTLSLKGRVFPASVTVIGAPFDGVVERMEIQFGESVRTGQVLFILGASAMEKELRSARAALSRAESAAMSDLDKKRASTSLETARVQLDRLRQRIRETETLVREGIVPRNELDELLNQEQAAKSQAALAREELAALKTPKITAAANLEMERLRVEVDQLEGMLERAAVRAPKDGLILMPRPSDREAPEISVGVKLSQGMPLGLLSDERRGVVKVQVDETDINAIKAGDRVGVVCANGRSEGSIVSMAAEAQPSATSSMMVFETQVEMAEIPAGCHLGMSATIEVVTYRNKAAIVLPPQAIMVDAAGAFVRIGGKRHDVVVGNAFPAGMEILSGLAGGEVIDLPANPDGDAM